MEPTFRTHRCAGRGCIQSLFITTPLNPNGPTHLKFRAIPAGLSNVIAYTEVNYIPRAWMADLGQPQDSRIDDYQVGPRDTACGAYDPEG
jgi:hypothetical protein